MSEETIIRQCSPTLAGIKTGSMFRTPFDSKNEMMSSVRRWNRVLKSKGIRVVPLEYRRGMALIYVYRPSRLCRDLTDLTAKKILRDMGYGGTPEKCISCLRQRIMEGNGFPHEVGLFLGYPPEDVLGFIEKGACGSICTGYWRVYGDVDQAKKTFAKYKKCSDIYYKQWKSGRPFDRLTVKY